ncbi:ABC transporter substrate-binding protein [Phytoactinopolyspora halotolerans]|uniref:ABC transporter substrate-binding protein n=1 Tax=Phytoactinopolyspora halotolerans TaxID=1981512 RepID=A0A6L9S595_9ACTN|nr:ABC transporter substrate-binding protein [Phytoactinopolyspora halotolerans]NED99239.1 ABC transporter substrate-binding protein [Phytoactinopolyspora halotolerans]
MAPDARRWSRRSALRLMGACIPAAALGALAGGCGSDDAGGSGTRVLRVSQPDDPRVLDPQKQGDMPSMNVLINIFDTLTGRDENNELVPRLALNWEPIDDLTWRFKLREGVTFHNGEPFDAQTVKFSIERLLNPETASPIVELRYVVSVTVVDDHTVDINTDQPDPIIPAKLSLFGGVMVPPGYIGEVGDAEFAERPVGTGPFQFVRLQRAVETELKANPDHWAGPPAVDVLFFKPIPNAASALAALQSDEVDLVTGMVPDAALQLEGYHGIENNSYPGIRTSYLSLDTEDPVLSDKRVRQALNHAVDVPQLIEAVLNGHAREVPTMIPRESFGFDETIEPYTRDLERARALLAEAGHPDGFSTTLTASNNDAFVAEAVSGLLARVGVDARVDLLDPAIYSARLTSENRRALGPIYLAASTGWTLDGSSNVQSNVRRDRRQSRWTSDAADALIDREELTVDPEARLAAFSELQKLLKEEAPFVFLYQIDNILVHASGVHWRPNVTGSLAMERAEVTT